MEVLAATEQVTEGDAITNRGVVEKETKLSPQSQKHPHTKQPPNCATNTGKHPNLNKVPL